LSIKDRLKEDLKSAMRGAQSDPQQKIRLSTIRLLNADIKNVEIMKKAELTNEEVIAVIQRQIKSRKDSIEQYGKGGRRDLVEKEEKEAAVLLDYLPEQLSDEELKTLVEEAIRETGATSPKDMGKVMGALMPRVKGKAEGGRVSKMASELLKG